MDWYGSVLRVRTEEKQSPARRGLPRASPTAAERRTADIRAARDRQAQRLLGASKRDYALQRRASPPVALLPPGPNRRRTAEGRIQIIDLRA